MRRRKKRRSKYSPEELKKVKAQRAHINEARSIFKLIGFQKISTAAKAEIVYEGTKSDLDDVFLYQNLVVLVEYTTKQDDLSGHLKKKKVLYDKIQKDTASFIEFLDTKIRGFAEARGSYFQPAQMRIAIVYCSLKKLEAELKQEVPAVRYLDYQYLRYFLALARAIRTSARFELFDFLGFSHDDVGKNVIKPNSESATYDGSILPEAHSNFGKDHKIVTFYVDPAALLQRCYVLRKDRWEENSNLYQRMISKKKLESIRKYLLEQKRVFVNNIIITLPEETHLLNEKGHTIDPAKMQKTAPITIQLPNEYNSIGLIDGQHRVFSYYEGGKNEQKIGALREQQNLLATGIVYPSGMSKSSKTKFEAKLFLEINSTQTNAKSDLKQAIGLLLHPFSAESIAKDVVNHLGDKHGPLFDQFERYFYEKGKLKTTSVVSYAVKPIVKLSGQDSFFRVWRQPGKNELTEEKNAELRDKYIEYCAKHINLFLSAAKASVDNDRWTTDKKEKKKMLTTTIINGLIICLRKIIEADSLQDFEFYRKKFGSDLDPFNFGKFKSSQYARMGNELYEKFFL